MIAYNGCIHPSNVFYNFFSIPAEFPYGKKNIFSLSEKNWVALFLEYTLFNNTIFNTIQILHGVHCTDVVRLFNVVCFMSRESNLPIIDHLIMRHWSISLCLHYTGVTLVYPSSKLPSKTSCLTVPINSKSSPGLSIGQDIWPGYIRIPTGTRCFFE